MSGWKTWVIAVVVVVAVVVAILAVSGVIGSDDAACTKFSAQNCETTPFDER